MLIAFFPVLVNVVVSLCSIDGEIIELMDSMAVSKRQIFWRVGLPNSLPYIVPALKVAAPLSTVGAMISEFVGPWIGLSDTDLLFAALFVVTAFGMIVYAVIETFKRRIEIRYGREKANGI